MVSVPTFTNILCPVDFSTSARHALTVATELARSSHAALTIAHIWQPPMPLYGTPDAAVSGELIVKLALSSHADLVVMGAHGRTGLTHVLIGSVAEQVVRHAPCAVLVVR